MYRDLLGADPFLFDTLRTTSIIQTYNILNNFTHIYSNAKIIQNQNVVLCPVLGEVANFGIGKYL